MGIFESISSQITLTDGMTFSVSQSKFSLIATEMEAGNIPSAGFSVSHPGRSDAEATIPRSVFGSLSTTSVRISGAIISETIFSGRNKSLIVSSSVFTISILGESVSDLNDPIRFRLRKKMVNMYTWYKYATDMKNLIYHFPTCYAYSVIKPIGELNLKRALDEDTGVFSSFFSFLSSSSPHGQTAVSGNSTLHQ